MLLTSTRLSSTCTTSTRRGAYSYKTFRRVPQKRCKTTISKHNKVLAHLSTVDLSTAVASCLQRMHVVAHCKHMSDSCFHCTARPPHSLGRSRKMASDSEKLPSVLNQKVTSTGSPKATSQQGSICNRVFQNAFGLSASASV